MTPKPTNRNEWHPAPEDAPILMGLTPRGLVQISPLYTVTEIPEDGYERETVVVVEKTTRFSSTLAIVLPGLCGHYDCGGQAEICMN